MVISGHEHEAALINILRWFDAPGALVFCATRDATRRLHLALVQRGFSAVMLSGELSQHERTSALDALRSGRARVGVCTDVAARGLDLPALDLVVHADLPTNPETLLHRSGRTGRAGRKGVSVLIVPHSKRRRAEQITNAARVRAIWSNAPSAEEIHTRDRERLLTDPMLEAPEGQERTDAEALIASHDPIAIAAALLRLYRRGLPTPEVIGQTFQPATDAPRPRAEPRTHERRERTHESGTEPTPDRGGDFVQFRISVGRNNRADPKWLVPLLCRVGAITKQDIGSIRVFDTDTRFEIRREASDTFTAAIADLPPNEPRITSAGDGPMPPRPFRPKPFGGKPGGPPRFKRRD
jgi:ATP-dependent RNA helicase DeaD